MVHRAVRAEEKRKLKNEEKVKKEIEDREKAAAEEKRNRDIILSARVPEDSRRSTKIAEVRAKMVRDYSDLIVHYFKSFCHIQFNGN